MVRIDALRLGLAGGIMVSVMMFVMTLVSSVSGFAIEWLILLKGIFIGYEVSVIGSLVGAGYGFFLGFIKLFLLAFIYNLLGPSEDNRS